MWGGRGRVSRQFVWLYSSLAATVQGIYSSPVAQICINFLTFWILLSYLVPISLFVTMEIVKFWQVSRGGGEREAGESSIARNCGIAWRTPGILLWVDLRWLPVWQPRCVPNSAYVLMLQGFIFINFDPHMKDPKTGEAARCRNSGLNEDLGKVSNRLHCTCVLACPLAC